MKILTILTKMGDGRSSWPPLSAWPVLPNQTGVDAPSGLKTGPRDDPHVEFPVKFEPVPVEYWVLPEKHTI